MAEINIEQCEVANNNEPFSYEWKGASKKMAKLLKGFRSGPVNVFEYDSKTGELTPKADTTVFVSNPSSF